MSKIKTSRPKIKTISRLNSSVLFVNFEAKKFYKICKNLNKDLVLLFAKDFDGAVLTQEAYHELVRFMDVEDQVTHSATLLDPSSASYVCETITTIEDIREILATKKRHK